MTFADPLGMPRSAYERMVTELDDLLDRLVMLAWPQATGPGAVEVRARARRRRRPNRRRPSPPRLSPRSRAPVAPPPASPRPAAAVIAAPRPVPLRKPSAVRSYRRLPVKLRLGRRLRLLPSISRCLKRTRLPHPVRPLDSHGLAP